MSEPQHLDEDLEIRRLDAQAKRAIYHEKKREKKSLDFMAGQSLPFFLNYWLQVNERISETALHTIADQAYSMASAMLEKSDEYICLEDYE